MTFGNRLDGGQLRAMLSETSGELGLMVGVLSVMTVIAVVLERNTDGP